jgi:DNA modification methylase
MSARVICGDALTVLAQLPAGVAQTCVTSPPYWGLRDYGVPPRLWGGRAGCEHAWGQGERGRRSDMLPAGKSRSQGRIGTDQRQARAALEGGQFCTRCGAWLGCLGLEPSPHLYVEHLVELLDGVRRVLRDDGTVWLNLGDSYSGSGPSGASYQSQTTRRRAQGNGQDGNFRVSKTLGRRGLTYAEKKPIAVPGTKPKDLIGVPWMVAFALREAGWWLRAEVIWAKPNPMPESVRDRPTRSHEHVFLLAKQRRYFYDHDAIREPDCGHSSGNGYVRKQRLTYTSGSGARGQQEAWQPGGGRNRRDVWTIAPRPGRFGHIAPFPEQLAEPCVLAGSSAIACGVCGAPWRRIVQTQGETSTERARQRGHTTRLATTPNGRRQSLDFQGAHTGLPGRRRQTTGWAPTCEHNDGSGRGLVLDPFCGSATTGVVAVRHGREFLGIELNPTYAEIARQRLQENDGASR